MSSQEISLEDFELLLETNRLLSSKLEIKELLFAIMELAGRVMRVEAASVLLLDEQKRELYFDVAIGGSGEKIKGVRIPVGHGIAGWVAQEGKPVIANDVAKDPRWRGGAGAASDGFATKAILACPLQVKGRIIGVVEAINRPDGSEFGFADLRLFEAFASQAAVAIDNARLFSNLKFEKQKLEDTFEQMADAVLLADSTGVIAKMNRRAEMLFADSPLRILTDLENLGFSVDPTVSQLLARTEPQGPLDMKRTRPKFLALSGNWSRIEDASGEGRQYLLVFRDVTESRKEEVLQRNFISMISHKLRTPLVAINGYIPFFREDSAKWPVPLQKALDSMDREGRHLAYLIEDLIKFTTISSFSGSGSVAQSRALANRIIEDALAKARPLLEGDKVEVIRRVPSDLYIFGDTGLLTEAVRSLVDNAVRFNNKPRKIVRLEAEAADSMVRIRIEDNGPGIAPEERERVFRWFHQVEEDFTGQVRGMGLGLAHVKKVVELHGGTVDLTSKVGEGTVFTLNLPRPT